MARKLNGALWLEHWSPALLAAAAASTVFVLWGRRAGVAPATLVTSCGVALGLSVFVAVWRMRDRFFSLDHAFVHLDTVLGLHNRLTAARKGVGSWPAATPRGRDGLRWRWSRTLTPLGFSGAMVLVAAQVPLTAAATRQPSPAEPPLAWQEMESWLEGLQEWELVAEQAQKEWQERLEQVRSRPRSEWYDHGSLEAGDSLHEQLEGALRSLEQGLSEGADALGGLTAGSLSGSKLDVLATQVEQTLENLQRAGMPLDERLASRLRQLKSMRSLSPRELQDLKGRLSQGARFCRLALRQCRPGDTDCLRVGKPGRSGVSRGPGTQPLTLQPQQTRLGTRSLEGISNEDIRFATLGDVVAVGRGEHALDNGSYLGGAAAGEVGSMGAGGDTIFKQSLTPEERSVLEKYFE